MIKKLIIILISFLVFVNFPGKTRAQEVIDNIEPNAVKDVLYALAATSPEDFESRFQSRFDCPGDLAALNDLMSFVYEKSGGVSSLRHMVNFPGGAFHLGQENSGNVVMLRFDFDEDNPCKLEGIDMRLSAFTATKELGPLLTPLQMTEVIKDIHDLIWNRYIDKDVGQQYVDWLFSIDTKRIKLTAAGFATYLKHGFKKFSEDLHFSVVPEEVMKSDFYNEH